MLHMHHPSIFSFLGSVAVEAPILRRDYLITGVVRDDLRKMTQTRAAPRASKSPEPLFWKNLQKFGCCFARFTKFSRPRRFRLAARPGPLPDTWANRVA